MRNKINLLTTSKDYQKITVIFSYFRIITTILGILIVVIFSSLYFLQTNVAQQIKILEVQEKNATQLKNQENNELNNQTNLLADRIKLINVIVKSSTPYDLLLSRVYELFPNSSGSADLESIKIDKLKNVTITLSFSTEQNYMEFLDLVESELFSNNFKKINISRISTPLGASDEIQTVFTGVLN